MGFHENINLAATHRQQTPLMKDGVAKKSNTGFRGWCDDDVRNDRGGGNLGGGVEGDFHFIVAHEHFFSP
ncbi:MAG: hypothetical protein CUN57_00165 [Phototrophicales bacterium]|nr:MAG: hypothetical protein CUN57_00165 [Phototrophicales bacterium]